MKRWRAAAVPYLLILPGGLWLVIFFAIPVIVLISLSTQQGNIVDGFSQTFHFANYASAWDNYHDQFIRSLLYGGIATILCILLGFFVVATTAAPEIRQLVTAIVQWLTSAKT